MTWVMYIDKHANFGRASLRMAKVGQDHTDEVTNITFERVDEGVMTSNPPVLHGQEAVDFLQSAMDAAFEYGLRPSGMQDERHIQAHLSDMQDITRHVLKMEPRK